MQIKRKHESDDLPSPIFAEPKIANNALVRTSELAKPEVEIVVISGDEDADAVIGITAQKPAASEEEEGSEEGEALHFDPHHPYYAKYKQLIDARDARSDKQLKLASS